jgi:hypothetical protein
LTYRSMEGIKVGNHKELYVIMLVSGINISFFSIKLVCLHFFDLMHHHFQLKMTVHYIDYICNVKRAVR